MVQAVALVTRLQMLRPLKPKEASASSVNRLVISFAERQAFYVCRKLHLFFA